MMIDVTHVEGVAVVPPDESFVPRELDVVRQIHHDVGAGRLLLDVGVDPGGRGEAKDTEQPGPVGNDDEIHGLKDPRLVQVVEERANPALSALAGY